VKLNIPSRMNQDQAIEAMEREDERQREALRAHLARERRPMEVTGKELVKAMKWVAAVLAFLALLWWRWW
jgi:hypothetical protein